MPRMSHVNLRAKPREDRRFPPRNKEESMTLRVLTEINPQRAQRSPTLTCCCLSASVFARRASRLAARLVRDASRECRFRSWRRAFFLLRVAPRASRAPRHHARCCASVARMADTCSWGNMSTNRYHGQNKTDPQTLSKTRIGTSSQFHSALLRP